jgi:hypothetical protein
MKTNLLLTLLAIGLSFSAYYDRTSSPPSDRTQTITAGEPLLSIPASEIATIRIRDRHRCSIVHAAAPSFTELFARLAEARILRRFAPALADYSSYGLAPPARQLDLFRRGEAPPVAVLVGSFNPVGNAVYVQRVDNADVLLVGGYFSTALDFALQQMPVASDLTCTE